MTAVLVLAGSSAIVVPAWFWIVAVIVAAAFGALVQWLLSAWTRAKRRQVIVRRLMTLTVGASAYILIADTCWVWIWLCTSF